ncbi:two-component sensor histidine kinase-malate [Fusibacter sp. 3D3]|nr:two-component sensor histidine kinase-malate [Fusibacter sp. 3D3]
MKNMKLQQKLTIVIIFLIVFSTGISSYFVSRFELKRMEKITENNLFNVASILADSSIISEGLYHKSSKAIQAYVEKQLASLTDVEIITIADMDGIRYGHPNAARLGETFVGGDEQRVIEEGAMYASIATGTLGRSVRVFAPVYYEAKQVGFVMAAHLFDDVVVARKSIEKSILIYTFIGIIVGTFGAVGTAIVIKKSLLGLEPYEIVHLYHEKDAMIKSLHEGILAIDENQKITMINDSAIKILRLSDDDVIGKDVMTLFPTTKLSRVLETGIAEYDKGQEINGANIMTNRVPILDGEKIVGALATFRDHTEVVAMAEEITGVKQIVEALRANTHEFMNKLHVIIGLIEIGDDALTRDYILELKHSQENIKEMVFEKIDNPMIGALLLGKLNRAKEEHIDLHLSEDSTLKALDYGLNYQAFIIILGNLIENAIEAIKQKNFGKGSIEVYLNDIGSEVTIQITDNGVGIEPARLSEIFNRGVTTKPGSNGIGLDIVSATIKRLGGKIEVDSTLGAGSTFTVIIPKEAI